MIRNGGADVENVSNEDLKKREENDKENLNIEDEKVTIDKEDVIVEDSSTDEDGVNQKDEAEKSEQDEMEPAFKIKSLENKLLDQEEALKRINAEYANFRRRTSEEKSTIALYANEKVMNELLPVLDNFERALSSCENKDDSLFKGVDMIKTQLIEALKKSGLEKISAEVGEDFDPNFHMAVIQEESQDFEAGKILMELQAGYKLGKKVIRASMVKVSC